MSLSETWLIYAHNFSQSMGINIFRELHITETYRAKSSFWHKNDLGTLTPTFREMLTLWMKMDKEETG